MQENCTHFLSTGDRTIQSGVVKALYVAIGFCVFWMFISVLGIACGAIALPAEQNADRTHSGGNAMARANAQIAAGGFVVGQIMQPQQGQVIMATQVQIIQPANQSTPRVYDEYATHSIPQVYATAYPSEKGQSNF